MLKNFTGAFSIVSVTLTIRFYAQLVVEALQIFVFYAKHQIELKNETAFFESNNNTFINPF